MKIRFRQTRKTVLVLAAAALAAGSVAIPLQSALAGGEKVRVFTELLPPANPALGIAVGGHGRAEVESQPGRERLKLDIDDVEVIGAAGDAAFCHGFYEVVLLKGGVAVDLPAFPGVIVACLIPGDPQGPTKGSLNFDVRMDKGATPINPSGGTLQIWAVEAVRDPISGAPIKGPGGEPFVPGAVIGLALEGVLN